MSVIQSEQPLPPATSAKPVPAFEGESPPMAEVGGGPSVVEGGVHMHEGAPPAGEGAVGLERGGVVEKMERPVAIEESAVCISMYDFTSFVTACSCARGCAFVDACLKPDPLTKTFWRLEASKRSSSANNFFWVVSETHSQRYYGILVSANIIIFASAFFSMTDGLGASGGKQTLSCLWKTSPSLDTIFA